MEKVTSCVGDAFET